MCLHLLQQTVPLGFRYLSVVFGALGHSLLLTFFRGTIDFRKIKSQGHELSGSISKSSKPETLDRDIFIYRGNTNSFYP